MAVAASTPPQTPAAGQAWIVGGGASAAWAGQEGAIAAWTPGGWRFAAPSEGMSAWSIADAGIARYRDGGWHVAASGGAIGAPDGGSVVDGEAREAIVAMLATMRAHGLIAS